MRQESIRIRSASLEPDCLSDNGFQLLDTVFANIGNGIQLVVRSLVQISDCVDLCLAELLDHSFAQPVRVSRRFLNAVERIVKNFWICSLSKFGHCKIREGNPFAVYLDRFLRARLPFLIEVTR